MGLKSTAPPGAAGETGCDGMGTDRAEEHSLAAEEPGELMVGSALPAIAAKADDLEEIKKAVEDAASVSGGLWLSYLFVLSYIAIAAGAVTHEDLLLIRPVKLPFLNVELPLKAFFALAPFVVLIIHAYALMHFIMLGKKASRFHNELRRQFPDQQTNTQKSGAAVYGTQKEIRDKLRRLLPSNIFVQILAGPPELRTGIFGAMLKLIAVTTLVVFPILLLLLLEIQFLPFHDVTITWAQRAALFLDIGLLWLLRPPILVDLGAESFGRTRVLARVLRRFGLGLAGVMSIVALWFSIVVSTIPGEWQDTALAALDRPRWQISLREYDENDDEVTKTKLVSTHELLFAGEVDYTTRRRKSLFSNTLVLPGFNLYEALKIDDPKKLAWKEHLFDLRARHLEKAVLTVADLTNADLTGAQLQGASLSRAHLQGATLDGAQLRGASLSDAQLQGASLVWAHLQGASLVLAQLQGAGLWLAQLQGTSLEGAYLQGASLYDAELQGASVASARLEGASLEGAQLQGVALGDAVVIATDFSEAFLWRTGGVGSALWAIRLRDVTWEPVWRPMLGPHLYPGVEGELPPGTKITFPTGKVRRWTDAAYTDLQRLMKSIPRRREAERGTEADRNARLPQSQQVSGLMRSRRQTAGGGFGLAKEARTSKRR
jgi:uncharacterized protein YjbI with pentapeptide repeats